jgi:hypothetical protein
MSATILIFCGDFGGYIGVSFKLCEGLFGDMTVYPQKEGNHDNFGVLGWWKSFAAKYPLLAQMARDILAIPVSIIPLDSKARTLNQYLSTMKHLRPCLVESRSKRIKFFSIHF